MQLAFLFDEMIYLDCRQKVPQYWIRRSFIQCYLFTVCRVVARSPKYNYSVDYAFAGDAGFSTSTFW